MKKLMVVLLQVGYWCMYVFILLLLIMAMSVGKNQVHRPQTLHLLFLSPLGIGALLPAIIGFYSSYLFVFKKYLAPKKIVLFIISEITVALFASSITLLTIYGVLDKSGMPTTLDILIPVGLFFSFIALLNSTLALVMKGFITWYNELKLKEELNRKNYEMELALMKAQISPHFLFNTINNIDTLILKDANKASEYLNKLSDMMRFMLYETKTEKITLSKELSYINNYIELQKIRTANPNYVDYQVQGLDADKWIEPMLFIPFIENAFKYADNKKVESAIRIKIEIEKTKISFLCSNSFAELRKAAPDQGGLGNELIKKRLSLLYPGKHTLEINNQNGIYAVHLQLHL